MIVARYSRLPNCLGTSPAAGSLGIGGTKDESAMDPALPQQETGLWLLENGLRELERLFRAIIYHPSEPILIADNDRRYLDASTGAGKLLGLARERLIGSRIDDFTEPSFRPRFDQLWQDFLKQGEQEGTLRLVVPGGGSRDVDYVAKGNVLPVRHLLVLARQDQKEAPRK